MDFHQKAAVGLSLILLLSVWSMVSVIVTHCVLRGMIVALILTCSVMYSHVCHVSYTYIAMIYLVIKLCFFCSFTVCEEGTINQRGDKVYPVGPVGVCDNGFLQ